jgi:hypothetical protein
MSKSSIFLLVALLAFCYAHYYYRLPGPCEINPTLDKIRQDLIKVEPKAANLQYYPSHESYTEDKEKIFLCMKDPNTGKEYDYNTLLLVMLHEIAHAFSPVVDKEHKTPEFNGMHNYYRKKASDMGLVNLNKEVEPTYCKH